ncbi:MAG: TIGR00730 family Rossman fold protein [Alphaproteobacteria bacterium]|nr:TIGR00730 family Rossman fold protein [Alphaproteobacteria bacterium]
MPDIASLCVYCGSSKGSDGRHAREVEKFGRLLGEACVELVYGGGNIGLMGVLADATLEAGGKVTGVIPTDLRRVELAHQGLDELVVVESMHERKRRMFERADAFAVLPGGVGTLDETFEIITWRQLGLHGKPVVIVNDGGYWQALIDLIEHTVSAGFTGPMIRDLFAVVDHVEDVLPAIATMPATAVRPLPEKT